LRLVRQALCAVYFSTGFPPFSGFLESAVPFLEDFLLPSFQSVLGRHVSDGPPLADADGLRCSAGRTPRPPGGPLPVRAESWVEGTPPSPFSASARLFRCSGGVVRRGLHVGHSAQADELLDPPEADGHELGAVVGDDPRVRSGKPFPSPLQDDLHVRCRHPQADIPLNHVPAATVQNGAWFEI